MEGRASDKGGMFEKLPDGGADECGVIRGLAVAMVDDSGIENM